MKRILLFMFASLVVLLFVVPATAQAAEVLPSWQGQPKQDIIDFVTKVATEGDDFVPPAERIAVFDNDGTLWAEQPEYFQAIFLKDQLKALAPKHPEWKRQQPFKDALDGKISGDYAKLLALAAALDIGKTTDEYAQAVSDWIATATYTQDDRFKGRLYTQLIYQPMLELLDYLRANDFKTYIVSGGGIDFMRPWTEAVYGIPPEQVVGSSVGTKFVPGDAEKSPLLVRTAGQSDDPKTESLFIDDNVGKPVGINQHIGRRPIASFGNSDGDLQMHQWVDAGAEHPHFSLYIHHTDAAREWNYDAMPDNEVGVLDNGLKEAQAKGWTVVDMEKDWTQVFPDLK